MTTMMLRQTRRTGLRRKTPRPGTCDAPELLITEEIQMYLPMQHRGLDEKGTKTQQSPACMTRRPTLVLTRSYWIQAWLGKVVKIHWSMKPAHARNCVN